MACEKEKFLEWVQDHSPSKFVRSNMLLSSVTPSFLGH